MDYNNYEKYLQTIASSKGRNIIKVPPNFSEEYSDHWELLLNILSSNSSNKLPPNYYIDVYGMGGDVSLMWRIFDYLNRDNIYFVATGDTYSANAILWFAGVDPNHRIFLPNANLKLHQSLYYFSEGEIYSQYDFLKNLDEIVKINDRLLDVIFSSFDKDLLTSDIKNEFLTKFYRTSKENYLTLDADYIYGYNLGTVKTYTELFNV